MIRICSLIVLTLCLAASPCRAASTNEKSAADSLRGRWFLTFELPDGYYQTPVEFVIKPDGQVGFTVLGSLGTFNITSGSGRLSGRKLSLNAETSWGKLKVKANLEGDTLRGTWSPAGFFASLFFKGEVRGKVAPARDLTANRIEVFDVVWEQVNKKFYDPGFNGANWQSVRTRYRPQVEAARTDGELVTIVRRMLAELRSSHLEFFATPDSLPVWTPKKSAQTKAVSWRRLSQTTGYLKLSSFEEGDESLKDIDSAFKEFANLPSLIIDVRGNSGGSLGIALRVGDHLFTSPRSVGYFVTRAGLLKRNVTSIDQITSTSLPTYSGYDSEGFTKMVEQSGGVSLVTGGRAENPYRGRVLLLIDEYSFSAAEAFASVAKETRAATLIGRRTSGAMLAAEYVSIADGWVLTLPAMDFRTAGGVRVEGVGVEPDISVKAKRGGDAELARALELLKAEKRNK